MNGKRRTWLVKVKAAWPALLILAPLACQQQMGQQPYYRPLQPSTFFADDRSARPLLPGTVAQGQLENDRALFTGKDGDGRGASLAGSLVGIGAGGPLTATAVAAPLPEKLAVADYVAVFPFAVDAKVLERGQQRFTIFCSPCHDATGNGRGKIVERGYTQPPSYITDDARGFLRRGIKIKLRDVPVGYYFQVVSKGYGAMPDYAAQVPARDRWAIIAYIRALQFSQHAPLEELPATERQAARKALEGNP